MTILATIRHRNASEPKSVFSCFGYYQQDPSRSGRSTILVDACQDHAVGNSKIRVVKLLTMLLRANSSVEVYREIDSGSGAPRHAERQRTVPIPICPSEAQDIPDSVIKAIEIALEAMIQIEHGAPLAPWRPGSRSIGRIN